EGLEVVPVRLTFQPRLVLLGKEIELTRIELLVRVLAHRHLVDIVQRPTTFGGEPEHGGEFGGLEAHRPREVLSNTVLPEQGGRESVLTLSGGHRGSLTKYGRDRPLRLCRKRGINRHLHQ